MSRLNADVFGRTLALLGADDNGRVPPVHTIANVDGSVSSERTISVEEEGLNRGAITVIPTIWAGEQLSDDEARRRAIASGLTFPSFGSHEEADKFAARRSKTGGAVAHGFLGANARAQPSGVVFGRTLDALGVPATLERQPEPPPPELPEEVDPTVPETVVDLAKKFVRGAVQTTAAIPDGVAELAEAIGELLPTPAMFEARQTPEAEAPPADVTGLGVSETVRKLLDEYLPTDPRQRDDKLGKIAEGMGSTIPFALAYAVSVPAAMAAGATVGAAEFAEEVEESEVPEVKKALATLSRGALGTTQAWPIGKWFRFLKPIDQATKGSLFQRIAKAGGQVAVSGVAEGMQEFAEQAGADILAKTLLESERTFKESLERTTEAGEIGTAVGLIFGVLARLAGIRFRPKAPTIQKGAEQAEEIVERVAPPTAPPTPAPVPPDIEPRVAALRRRGLSEAAARREAAKRPVEPVSQAARPVEQPVPVQAAEQEMGKEVAAGRIVIEEIEKAQQETKVEGLRALPPSLRSERITGRVKVPDYYPTQEVADRFAAARGVPIPKFREKALAWAKANLAKVVRPQEHLPDTPQFSSANQYFVLQRGLANTVADEFVRHVGSVTGGLDPKDMRIFEDFLVARNQLVALDQGQPLRTGFKSRAEVEEMIAGLDAIIQDRPAIRDALETRARVNVAVAQELVNRGHLPDTVLSNVEDYFHQQVLMYAEVERMGRSAGPRQRKRPFQRKRFVGAEELPAEYDYNTAFVQSEARWLTDAYTLLRAKALFDEFIVKPYDRHTALVEEAGRQREATGEDVQWHDLMPEGYTEWYPQPGNIVYPAFTVPERLAERLIKKELESAELTADQLRTVLALGAKRPPIVVPQRIASQLDVLEKGEGNIERIDRQLIGLWKGYILIGPKSVLSYNARNYTGDGDAVIAGAVPGLRKQIVGPTKELWRYYQGEVAMSPELKAARDLSVLDASFVATEIPSLEEIAVFSRFLESRTPLVSLPAKAVKKYFDTARKYTKFREATLRYSTFLAGRKALQAGNLRHFGASRRAVIEELVKRHGVDVGAAKYSRDLLGDYGNITVMGRWLRSHLLPFWSWQELNLRRIPRLAINSVRARDIRGMGAIPLSMLRMILFSRLAWLYAGFWAWNNLRNSHKEEELTAYDRQNPHIVVCRNSDGSVRVFRNIGMLGDALEWFGLNTFIALLPQLEEESLTGEELLQEMAKDPVNRVYQSVRPDMKAFFEIPAAMTGFPDVMNPRYQERGETAAAIFRLRDEYRGAKGALLKNGQRVRPHYAQRILVGVVDPRKNALSEMYALRDRYLARLGIQRRAPLMRSAFQDIRRALQDDNFEAYQEALAVFVKNKVRAGQDADKSYMRSLAHLDPISQRLNNRQELDFEQNFLNGDQRDRLRVAREYAQELDWTARSWWRDSYYDVVVPILQGGK